ncbi:MAG: beta-1,6-N-acetylglucosaminyltransferase [Pseudomonadota bacterium]
MKLAILLLCHEPADVVASRLASPFFAHPDVKVYLHYDAARSAEELAALKAAVPPAVQHAFVAQRVHCEWGDYSLVEATHRMMRLALSDEAFGFDYAALISASCIPIRPLSSLQEFLRRRRGLDFIQAVDVERRKWVKGGLEKERFQFYFPFSFKKHRWLFERCTALQALLRVRRAVPEGLRVHFGSQWFCLTRATVQAVSARLDEPALQRYFARSWIPDEFAIQSLVVQVQRPERIAGHALTYYEFDDQGRPLVLENGQFEHLMQQPFFFARKVSPHAGGLLTQIEDHLGRPERDLSYFERAGVPTSDYARFLVRALTLPAARSRVGTVQDGWRSLMSLSERRYLVLYGTSRRFALELTRRAREAMPGLPVFDFVFDPQRLVPAADSPAWLGIQAGMKARRDYDTPSFLYELAHLHPTMTTAFCVDPAVPAWVRDFVLWDPNATLVCCEPAGLGKFQRAEAALRDISVHEEGALFETTLQDVQQPKWLPQDHFEKALRETKVGCQVVRLGGLQAEPADETLRVIRAAWMGLSPNAYFASSEEEAKGLLYARRPSPGGPA